MKPIKWTFRSFVSDTGRRLVHEWYDGQSPDVQAAFDTALEYLQVQPPHKWVRPHVGILSGKCKGLIEIIFKADNVQHRPLGFYSPSHIFTIVFFATEKGGELKPKDACKTAIDRKSLIEKTGGSYCEWDV